MIHRHQPQASMLSLERLSRLHQLAMTLIQGPVDKNTLIMKLNVGLRTFYRDIISLEEFGLCVVRSRKGYALAASTDEIEKQLPFPDPGLNFAEARALASDHHPAAQRIAAQLSRVLPKQGDEEVLVSIPAENFQGNAESDYRPG